MDESSGHKDREEVISTHAVQEILHENTRPNTNKRIVAKFLWYEEELFSTFIKKNNTGQANINDK